MGLWQLIVISTGLSLDVFAYCLYKGAMISAFHKLDNLKMIALFTGFQTGMMIAGSALTQIKILPESYQSAGRIWTLLAAIAFFSIGIHMIVKAVRKRKNRIVEKKQDDYNYRIILFWAFLTSIDALIAGIGCGFMGMQFVLTALVITLITAASGTVGLICGYRLGCGPMNKFVAVGGCLVLVGGVDLLIHYLSAVF